MNRRVALVTGGSRGLGASIARRLGAAGYAVAVNHRDSKPLADEVVANIVSRGGAAAAFAADVTEEGDVEDMVSKIEADLGAVDVVVANATGPQPSIGVGAIKWDSLLDQLNYFVKSPTILLNAVLPGMKERRHGRFVHIGSQVVDLVTVGSAAYVCAKTAQRGLARSWAKELGEYGITVNTVAPGWIPVERHEEIDQAVFDAYRSDLPATRMGIPDDIANAVAYLCSEEAAFVNGATLTVNGGKTVD